MSWQLSPTLSYARCGDQAVFLDLAADRYFALSPEQSRALEWALAAGDRARSPTGPIVRALEDQGILERSTSRPDRAATTPTPAAAEIGGEGRGSVRGFAHAAFAWRRAVRDVRALPLLELRCSLGEPGNLPAPRTGDLAAIAADFRRLSRLVPFQDRCLPATLAFVRTARRRGHRVALVFGVRLHPFCAHCWAQAGPVVLNDRLEAVQAFTPIAAW